MVDCHGAMRLAMTFLFYLRWHYSHRKKNYPLIYISGEAEGAFEPVFEAAGEA